MLTPVVSYWYYLRVAWFMWMKEAPHEAPNEGADEAPAAAVAEPIHVPVGMRVALIAGVFLILYLGVFPGATLEFARSSVAGLSAAGSNLIGLTP